MHTVPKAIIPLFQSPPLKVMPLKHSPFLDFLTIIPSNTTHPAARSHRQMHTHLV